MCASAFFSYRTLFPTERGAGGIGRQMTQQLDSSFEANYVCLTTLSVLHMPWSAPYLLPCCLRTFLPIPRPAGGPFPMGRGFAIRDDPFLKLRGTTNFDAPHLPRRTRRTRRTYRTLRTHYPRQTNRRNISNERSSESIQSTQPDHHTGVRHRILRHRELHHPRRRL